MSMKVKLIRVTFVTFLIIVSDCFLTTEIYAQSPLTVASATTITTPSSYSTGDIQDTLKIRVPGGSVTFSGDIQIINYGAVIVEEGSLIVNGKTYIDNNSSLIVESGNIRLGSTAIDTVVVGANSTLRINANPDNIVDTIMGRIYLIGEIIVGNKNPDDSVVVWNPNGIWITEGRDSLHMLGYLPPGKFTLQGRAVWFKGATGDMLDWNNPDNVNNRGNIIIKENAIFYIGSMPEAGYYPYSSVIGSYFQKTGFLNMNGTIEIQNNGLLWFGMNSELRSGFIIEDTARITLSDDAIIRATTSRNQSPWNETPSYSIGDSTVEGYFINAVVGYVKTDMLTEFNYAVSKVEMSGSSKLVFNSIINGASIINNNATIAKSDSSGYGIIYMKDESYISVSKQLINAHSPSSTGEIHLENQARMEVSDIIINGNMLLTTAIEPCSTVARGLITLRDNASISIIDDSEFGGGLTNGDFGKGKIELYNQATIEVSEVSAFGAIINAKNKTYYGHNGIDIGEDAVLAPYQDSILLYDSAKIISNVPLYNASSGNAVGIIELNQSSKFIQNRNTYNNTASDRSKAYINLFGTSEFIQNGSFYNGTDANGGSPVAEGILSIKGGTFTMAGDTLANGRNGVTGSGIINLGETPPSNPLYHARLFINKNDGITDYNNKLYLILNNPINISDTNGLFLVNSGEYVEKEGNEGFEWTYSTTRNATNTFDIYDAENSGTVITASSSLLDIADFALLNKAVFDIQAGAFIQTATANDWCYFDPSTSPSTVIYSYAGGNVFGTKPIIPYGRLVINNFVNVSDDIYIAGKVTNALTYAYSSNLILTGQKIVFVREESQPFYGAFSFSDIAFSQGASDNNIDIIGKMGREKHPYDVMIEGHKYILHNNLSKIEFEQLGAGGNILLELVLALPTKVSDPTATGKYAARKLILHNSDGSANGHLIGDLEIAYQHPADIPTTFTTGNILTMFAKGCDPTIPGIEINNGVASLSDTYNGNNQVNVFYDSLKHQLVSIDNSGTCSDNTNLKDGDEILLMETECHITEVTSFLFSTVVNEAGGYFEFDPNDFIVTIPAGVLLVPTPNPNYGNGTDYGTTKGRVEVANNKIVYIPSKTAGYGIDSINYYVHCGDEANIDSGKIYIFIYKTTVGEYWACPTSCTYAPVRLEMKTISGVTYSWYDANGTAITTPANPSNYKNINKDNSEKQIIRVDATTTIPGIGSYTFSDTIYIYKGTICGSITNMSEEDRACIKDTATSENRITPFPSGTMTQQQMDNWINANSNYISSANNSMHYNPNSGNNTCRMRFYSAGTSSNSMTSGNGQAEGGVCGTAPNTSLSGNVLFVMKHSSCSTNYVYKYTKHFDEGGGGICANDEDTKGDKVAFTFNVTSHHGTTTNVYNNLRFVITDVTDTDTLYIFKTGCLPNGVCAYSTYGFVFSPPADGFTITLWNDAYHSSASNVSFCMDEPLIYVCKNNPVITTESNDPSSPNSTSKTYLNTCNGEKLRLDARYIDQGMLVGPTKRLHSVWQFRQNCNSGPWVTLDGTNGTINTYQSNYSIGETTIYPWMENDHVTAADSGCYRVLVATYPTALDASNSCVLVSDNISQVKIEGCVVAVDDNYGVCQGSTTIMSVTDNDTILVYSVCNDISYTHLEILTPPLYGTCSIDAPTETIHYTSTSVPPNGVDSLFYKLACDPSHPNLSDSAWVYITVEKCVIANDDSYFTFSSIPVTCDVVTNDYVSANASCGGISNASVTITTFPSNGSVEIIGQTVKYTADLGYYGSDIFCYKLTCGIYSDDACVDITIGQFPDNVLESDCNVPVADTEWSIRLVELLGNDSVTTLYPAMVGDLDGDGKPELVVPGSSYKSQGITETEGDAPSSYIDHLSNFLFVFSRDANDDWQTTKVNVPEWMSLNSKGIIGLAEGKIVVACADARLRAYDKNGSLLWVSNENYTPAASTGAMGGLEVVACSSRIHTNVMFADFMGDGNPVVVTWDKIWDLNSGRLLLDLDYIPLHYYNGRLVALNRRPGTLISIVDVDKDGHPELVWGAYVFKINLTNYTDTLGNSFSILTEAINPPIPAAYLACSTAYPSAAYVSSNYSVANASPRLFTIPADFDGDGNVEILVYSTIQSSWGSIAGSTDGCMYIYDPITGVVRASEIFPTGDLRITGGSPFVGCIDGDGLPEIMVGQGLGARNVDTRIYAYDVDLSGSGSITMKWSMPTMDESSKETGITLFDFRQNGLSQIIYRDEERIRIFDGSGGSPVELFSAPCFSGTLGEYPVIADIDGDGEAEIIIVGSNISYPSSTAGKIEWCQGHIMIFKSGMDSRWAPARPVWNQYCYNVVNINQDLSVPTRMFDIATFMAGPDETYGTADDVQPFNAYLKQGTTIDKYGNMVAIAAKLEIVGSVDFNYEPTIRGIDIEIKVENTGETGISPVCFAVYKDAIDEDNLIATYCDLSVLPVGSSKTYNIELESIANYLPIEKLIVRLNDNGENYPVAAVCNEKTIERDFDFMILFDDTVTIRSNNSVYVDVLSNDIVTCAMTTAASSMGIKTPPTASLGTATIENYTTSGGVSRPHIKYSTLPWKYGIDSLEYYTICVKDGIKDSVTAWVYIYIYRAWAEKYYACPDAEIELILMEADGITYNIDNTLPNIIGSSNTSITVIKDSAHLQVFEVEPIWEDRFSFPNFELELYIGSACKDAVAAGCFSEGTILFEENFGGNDPADPIVATYRLKSSSDPSCGSSNPNDCVTSYPWTMCPSPGTYHITKITGGTAFWGSVPCPQAPGNPYNEDCMNYGNYAATSCLYNTNYDYYYYGHPYWKEFRDKTMETYRASNPGVNVGYFAVFDADEDPSEKMYDITIDGLCPNAILSFSLWAATLDLVGSEFYENYKNCNLGFVLRDGADNDIILARFETGEMLAGIDTDWRLYGFQFATSSPSVRLQVINNAVAENSGNLVIDDIQIRICYPKIEVTSDSVLCLGDEFDMLITATFDDTADNFGFATLKSDWQKRGAWIESTRTYEWITIASSEDTHIAGSVININYSKNKVEISDAGYYRIRLTGLGTDFESSRCVVISDPFYISVKTCGSALAVKNGRWADPETWLNVEPPAKDDIAIIPEGIIVYTGATSKAFGGRAYGQGADLTMGTHGTEWELGPNETGLVDNLLPDGQTIQLAKSVKIERGGALVISQLTDITGMTANTASSQGANDLLNYRLEFGQIINYSDTTIASLRVGSSSHPTEQILLDSTYNYVGVGSFVAGLYIVSSSTDTLAQAMNGTGVVDFALINDTGYIYQNGGSFKVGSIMNTNEGIIFQHASTTDAFILSTGNIVNASGTVTIEGTLNTNASFINGTINGETAAVTISGFLNVAEWFRNAPTEGSFGSIAFNDGAVGNIATSITEVQAKFLNGSHGDVGDAGYDGYGTSAGTAILNVYGANLNIYRSLYNGLVPLTNTNDNTNIVAPVKVNLLADAGVVKVYESVKSYNRVGGVGSQIEFNINSGQFIMTGTPPTGHDSLITQRRIEVFEDGQFVIDTDRLVNMSGATELQMLSNPVSGGIVLNSNTVNVANYLTLEALPNVTSDDVLLQGSFAMLQGSKLYIHRDFTDNVIGIINNNSARNNVYFHRGSYTDSDNKPSVVSLNYSKIMPTIGTHPYGRLEIFLGGDLVDFNYLSAADSICIGGKSDSALMIVGGQGTIFYSPIVFVDAIANLIFYDNYTSPSVTNGSWHGIAIGTVERRTTIFGYATVPNRQYVFTNRYTYINFSVADDELPRFALTTKWSHPGGVSGISGTYYYPPTLVIFGTDISRRGQRYYSVDFDTISSGLYPRIQTISLDYLSVSEISNDLFVMRDKLMIGAGYNSAAEPMLLAPVDSPEVLNSPANVNSRYLATNTNIMLRKTGANPAVGELESGNELILYVPSVFTTVRPGRWSDPQVWATGMVPSEEDSVIIRHVIYTGLWAGAGNSDGSIVPPNNLLFGARPYGRAESEINNVTVAGIKEAWLSGKLKIIEPDSWAPEGETPLPAGPSALLICNYLLPPLVSPASNSNYYIQCDYMDWDVVLVFSEDHIDLNLPKAIEVQAGGSTDEMTMTFSDFLNLAKSINYTANPSATPSPSYYDLNLNGLYIIVDDPYTAPIIRTLGIENKGLIQNEGIIDIGK